MEIKINQKPTEVVKDTIKESGIKKNSISRKTFSTQISE